MEARRLARALQLLAAPRLTLKQVADACGYRDSLYFSRVFLRHFGTRPGSFRAPLAPSERSRPSEASPQTQDARLEDTRQENLI